MPYSPILIGLFLVLAALRRRAHDRPASVDGRVLGYRFGVKPSGPNGTYTRRDRFRAAGASAIAAVGCLGIAVLGAYAGANVPLHNWVYTTTAVVMFLSFFIGVVALAATVVHFGAAFFVRGTGRQPSPGTPSAVARPSAVPINSPAMTESMTSSPAPALQFDRAVVNDGSAPAAGVVCASCNRKVVSSYFTVAEKPFCGSCKAKFEWAARGSKTTGAFLKAIVFGLGAAIAGAAIYFGVMALLNLEIGLIAILIGYMVGSAIRKAARGGGGRRYQILGAALTYLAVGMAYTPMAVQGALKETRALTDSTHAASLASATLSTTTIAADTGSVSAKPLSAGGMVRVIALALFLVVSLPVAVVFGSGAGGILSAVIIGIGIRQAWRMTAARNLTFVGPLKVASAGTAADAAGAFAAPA
jgi:hypothetical protein